MSEITQYLSTDHRECDQVFADAEGLVDKQDWEAGETQFNEFLDRMETHFRMEEEILFPEFERRTGMTQGPTAIMRMEHATMREIFLQMKNALQEKDRKKFLGFSENLLFTMQQHNSKEEQMLYPTADRVMGPDSEGLVNRLKEGRA